MVETLFKDLNETELKIACVGNVDSGKSTLIGVLTKGICDNGRGSAREKIFNFFHEKETGRTTSITQEIMGISKDGNPCYPSRFNQKKNVYWSDVVKKSDRIINFLDLCGHEKYLKTTIYGIMSQNPDFSMVIVGSNMGIQGMTKEHIQLTQALNIPEIIVMTKIDICPMNIFKENLQDLKQQLIDKQKTPFLVSNKIQKDQIQSLANSYLDQSNIVPIFCVSSVTMDGIKNLQYFLSLLKIKNIDEKKQNVQFNITDTFEIKGIGQVFSGVLKSGTIQLNQNLLYGPDSNKNFVKVSVKSIHQHRQATNCVQSGSICCLAIKSQQDKNKLQFKKGMILVDINTKPKAYKTFEIEFEVFNHATTIKTGYQGVFHNGTIKQMVKLIEIKNVSNQKEQDFIRSGAKGIATLQFVFKNEYVKENSTFILREGTSRIFGKIKSLIE